jgi:hypothetical protein
MNTQVLVGDDATGSSNTVDKAGGSYSTWNRRLSARWRKIPRNDFGFSEFKFMTLPQHPEFLLALRIRCEPLTFQPLLQRSQPYVCSPVGTREIS